MSNTVTRLHRVLLAVVVSLLAACGSRPAGTGTPAAPQLATLEVGGGGDASGQSWDGVVEAVQQAVISAQTGGRVSSMAVDVNDHVAAGAVLLRLTAVEQQAGADTARAQLKASEAVLEEAESRFRRSSELVARQLVSRADFDLARAARDSAAAARDAARAQLLQAEQQTAYTVVRAPYAGVVSARHVEPGEVVASGQSLLDFYAPGALRVAVQVPQSEAAKIRTEGAPHLVLADGRRVATTAMTIYPSADPVSHAVTVRVQLPTMPDPPRSAHPPPGPR
jgi:RND family efflux transporter MFP subunit